MPYRLLPVALLAIGVLQARGVRVAFDPRNPQVGPFPTDFLTVPDPLQKTGLKVSMPRPDCGQQPGTCVELQLTDGYDGFALDPRIRVKFSGPINPDTLRDGIYFVWFEKLSQDEYGLAPLYFRSPINNVVWDPATNTAFAKSDTPFDQSRRYLIAVTDAVKDLNGDPVEMDEGFRYCLDKKIGGGYCERLSDAVGIATPKTGSSVPPAQIVGGSLFTTMSATAFLEAARRSLDSTNPGFSATGNKAVLNASDISTFKVNFQVKTSGDKFETVNLPVAPVLLAQLGLGRIAFGSISSPRFLGPDLRISDYPSTMKSPPVYGTEQIFFQVFLPNKPAPAAGYPVAIVAHGILSNRFQESVGLVPGYVGSGMAVIGLNLVGHGFGPEGTVEVTERSGTVVSFPAGGRSADLNGDGVISDGEGGVLFSAQTPTGARDTMRQSALDFSQLVRAIQLGMDLDGDGKPDLDANNIHVFAQSLGATPASMLHAIEPGVQTAVLTAGAGSIVEAGRLGSFRPLLQSYFGAREPALLNSGTDFNENLPLRWEAVRINTVPGAIELQDAFDRLEWAETPGAAQSYATHFFTSTLPGVQIKPTLLQFAWGDQTVPNPVNMALLRAANRWETAVVYRTDWAREVVPTLPRNPHTFLFGLDSLAGLSIAIGGQQQGAGFMLSRGTKVPDANAVVRPVFKRDLFQSPPPLAMELLNFAPEPAQ